MMKFVLFLVLGLCAFQQLSAQSEELKPLQQLEELDDFIDDIKRFIQQLKDFIRETGEYIQEGFVALQGYFRQLGAMIKMAFDDMARKMQDFKADLEKVKKAFENGGKCVAEHQTDIDNWENTINTGINQCKSNADTQSARIQHTYDDLNAKIGKFAKDTADGIWKCFTSSLSLKAWAECLKDEFQAAGVEFDGLIQSAKDFINAVKSDGPLVMNSFNMCIKMVDSNAQVQAKTIMQEINACINI